MNTDPVPYQWALPESLEVPSDPLEIRLDFHHDAIVMYTLDTGTITTRIVSAIDICQALVRDVPFSSGLLPPEALWWSTSSNGPAVALWRNPQTRKVALRSMPPGGGRYLRYTGRIGVIARACLAVLKDVEQGRMVDAVIKRYRPPLGGIDSRGPAGCADEYESGHR